MKPFRIFLIVFFSVLVLAVTTIVILLLRTDPKQVFRSISDQIEKSVSLQVRAGGVQLDLLKGIELSNVRIVDTASRKSNTLATFEHGRILYNPIALLWSRIDIISVSASGFKITFDDLQHTISNIISIVGRSTNSENSLGILIRSISVERSVLVFNGIAFSVKGSMLFGELLDDSFLSGELTTGAGAINFSGKLNAMDVTIKDLDLGALTGVKEKLVLNSVRAKLEKESDTVYRFSGEKAELTYLNYTAAAATPFTGRFDMQKNELRLSEFGLRSGKSVFHLDRFRTSTIRPDLEIGFSGIQAVLSEWLPGAEGYVYGTADVRSVTNIVIGAELALSNCRYQFVRQTSGLLRLSNNVLNAEVTGEVFGGNFSATARGQNVFGGPLQLDVQLDRLNLEAVAVPTNSQTGKSTNQDASVPPYIVNGHVVIGKIAYKKKETGKSELKFSTTPSGIRLLDGRVELLKGKLALKGDYTAPVFTGEAVLTEGKMKEFTALFLDSGKKLYGTVSGKASFKLDSSDPYRSSGDFSLLVSDGEIEDVFIQNRMSAVLFDIPLDDIFFDSIEMSGKLSDGILDVKSFRFNSDNIRMNASGRLDVRRQDLQFRSDIYFNKDYLSALPNVAQIFTSGYDREGRIAFGIDVSGTLKSPSVQIEKTK